MSRFRKPCLTRRNSQRTSFVPLEYHYRTTIQKTSRKQRASTYLWSTTIVPPFIILTLTLHSTKIKRTSKMHVYLKHVKWFPYMWMQNTATRRRKLNAQRTCLRCITLQRNNRLQFIASNMSKRFNNRVEELKSRALTWADL